MLQGKKPLAVFHWIEGCEVDRETRYLRLFDRHVKDGRLRKSERVRPVPQLPNLADNHVCYMLPGQEWRADAIRELYALPKPWTSIYERRLGELLGYEDWQNDIWLEKFKQAG